MNTKTALFFSLASIYSLTGNTQNIKWGMSQKSATDSRPSKMIGYDAMGVYVVKTYNNHENVINATYPALVTLEKYDFPDMKREYSKEIDLTEDGKPKGPDMYCDGIYCMKDNLLMLIYGNDVKTLYGEKIMPDGNIDNNRVQIGTVVNKWKKSILAESRYVFTCSRDKSALVGVYINEKEKNKITLKAIDENSKELWTKDFDNAFPGKKTINIIKIHSLDGGVVYALVSFGKEDSPDGYAMVVCDNRTTVLNIYKIELGGDKFPNLIDFDVDNSGNAVMAGYYGDNKSKETVIGSFNVRIDQTGKSLVNKTTEFDKDFLAHIINDGKIKRGKGIDQLGMKGIVVRDDGSAIISAEQSTTYNGYTVFRGQGGASYTIYDNNPIPMQTALGAAGMGGISSVTGQIDYFDVIIAKINTDGSTAWVKSVAKKQSCQYVLDAPSVCSFGLYIGAQDIYVLYNNSKKNAEKNTQAVLDGDNSDLSTDLLAMNAGHPALVYETIDIGSGKAKRGLLSGEGEHKLRLYSDVALQVAPDKVVIYSGEKGKEEQLGQLTIQ